MAKSTTSKSSTKEHEPTGFNWQEKKAFVDWWKEHQHAGYYINGTRIYWTITPPEAWNVYRYRLEYAQFLEDDE